MWFTGSHAKLFLSSGWLLREQHDSYCTVHVNLPTASWPDPIPTCLVMIVKIRTLPNYRTLSMNDAAAGLSR